ncbi:MAG: AGE family epimerase/isomerase [Bacteroidales bacterium]|nr:AGE family epimerase/isomerase [Bacteroidales bacterium]
MQQFDRNSFLNELEMDILPFWMDRMTDPAGGFRGRIDGHGNPVNGAEKGAILNSRILWTFSAAARMLGRKEYLDTAAMAYSQIKDLFTDRKYGGVFWSLDPDGTPRDTKKQFYAIAFAIYGLSEYYRVTGEEEALELAKSFYECLERHSYDDVHDGYGEACGRDWSPIGDVRLSDKDQNDSKTMNTHLHILEGYTNLYRVWKDGGLQDRLANLIWIFINHIIREDGHLGLFFGDNWEPHSTMVSYGHDIEASWLLREAADVLGEPFLKEKVDSASRKIAAASLEGWSAERGMIYEYDPASGIKDADRHWWVQAETVVGCVDQYGLSGDYRWLKRAAAQWEFIRHNIICPDGEWYWSVREDGSLNLADDRAGFWKCPYHNGRMCLEMLARL